MSEFDVVGSLLPVSPLRAAMDAYSVVRAERDEAGKVFTHGDHERSVKAALEAAVPLILAAAYDRLADELATERDSGRFGLSGSFGSGIQRAVLKIQQARASVLREGDPK